MATTGAVLRQRLSELVEWEGWAELTTSSAGAGDGTTLVDTSLAMLNGGNDDDFCVGWYVVITSGSADTGISRVSGYAQSTNTITVSPAFTAQIANGVTYELHQYHPTAKRNALNRAGDQVFPDIYLPVYDETLVTDQLGLNMDFEGTFSGDVPANWTELSSSTQTTTQETTRIFHGSSSVSLAVSSGSTDMFLSQDLTVNIADIVGHSMVFGGFMWSSVADSGWFRIDFGTGGINDSAKHTGDEDWQEESVTVSIPSDATQIRIRCVAEADNTPTTYFDSLYCYIKQIDRYTIPTSFVLGPFHVQMQIDRKIPVERLYRTLQNWWVEQDGENRYLFLGENVSSGYRLRLNGANALTLPTSDTTSMEVEDNRMRAVVEFAAAEMFYNIADSSPGLDAGDLENRGERHLRKAAALLSRPGVKMSRSQTLTVRSHVI